MTFSVLQENYLRLTSLVQTIDVCENNLFNNPSEKEHACTCKAGTSRGGYGRKYSFTQCEQYNKHFHTDPDTDTCTI